MYSKDYLLSTGYFINNQYFDMYYDLLLSNVSTEFVPCETNSHHVLPRHYFVDNDLTIDSSDNNKVNLLYKDHMLAHMYMSACTEGRNRYRNLYAITFMSGQQYASDEDIEYVKDNLDNYQELYRAAIDAAPNHWKGRKRPESTRKKMSKAHKGTPSPVKGKVWVNNGIVNRAIQSNEIQSYLSDGWIKGRVVMLTDDARARMDAARKAPRSAEFCEKMRQIALNQPAHSKESLDKISKGVKEYYKTHSNPFKGKHHTEESKQKFKETLGVRKYVKRGDVCKRVRVEELDVYLQNGWVLGRLLNNKDSAKH